MPKPSMSAALSEFIAAINATGGLTKDEETDNLVPVADPEWLDLGEAYLSACKAMDITPVIEENDDD